MYLDDFLKAVMSFDWSGLLKTLGTLAASAFALFKFGARQSALRDQIKGDLDLIEEINKNALLRDQTSAAGWLHGKILVDIAKLSRVPMGTKKKPIPWGSVVFASVGAFGFGYWTLDLNRFGFNWWSVLTGTVAGLFFISVLGMISNRDIAPDKELPPGAVPVQSEVASEHIAGRVAALSMTAASPQFGVTGVATAALEIFGQLQGGFYSEALDKVEPLWLECRIRSWIWNNQGALGLRDESDLEEKLQAFLTQRESESDWDSFVETETQQFKEAWSELGVMGAGSTRRMVMPGIELVILAPVGATGGYYVPTATIVPHALTFLMRKDGSEWKLLNHAGAAPPLPGWPPVWWIINDPVFASPDRDEQPELDLN